MKTKFFAILLLLVGGISCVNAQSVDQVVKKYMDARGGEDRWSKLSTLKMHGSIEIAPNMTAPFTMFFKDKNKFRFELELQGMKMIQALDGDSGWSVMPFMGKMDPERMSAEEIKSAKEQADFTGDLHDYKKKGNQVEVLGTEDMEGTETIKVKVLKKNQDITYLNLDATSYLTLKESQKIKMQDKEVESFTYPSNYKEVNGYTFPFSFEVRGSDQESMGQVMNIEKIEINPVIEDALFLMPAITSAVQPTDGSKK